MIDSTVLALLLMCVINGSAKMTSPYTFVTSCESTFKAPWEGTQLYYLATGLGNLPRDPALVVDVAEDGKVTIRGYTLATGEFFSVEDMGAAYWDPKVYPGGKLPEVLEPFLEK